MRSPGFEPELPACKAEVLDQAGRQPHRDRMHLAIATLDLNLRLPQYDMRSISSYLHLDTNIIRISP